MFFNIMSEKFENRIMQCHEELKPPLAGHEQLASKHLAQPCQQKYSSSGKIILHLILTSFDLF